MEKIGNILTNSKDTFPDYFNISDTLDFGNDLPTLIIGFDLVLKLYRKGMKTYDNSLGDNLYWTFLKSENRAKFEIQLELFTNDCLTYQTNKSSYIFMDLVHSKKSKLLKVTKKILSLNEPISLVYRDMVYIYGEDLIFGIDLHLCHFVGLNRNKILNKIKSISKHTLDYDEIIIEYKDFLGRIDNEVMYLPILYSIKNGKS